MTLEYYFEGVGLVSLGGFRREIENLFGNTVFNATPAFLALYGLDPATYDPYDVATTENVPSTVRTDGFDFNYKQALCLTRRREAAKSGCALPERFIRSNGRPPCLREPRAFA